jgi:hypothetical protein
MKAMTTLPSTYSQQAVLDFSKNSKLIVSVIVAGIVLLITACWLLVQFIDILRPTALDGMRFRDILTATPTGISFNIPSVLVRDFVIALVFVLIIHELVHGLFYWWLSGKRPKFGLRGLLPYTVAPVGVFFPRNHFLAVGIAPLVLLTLVGLLLMVIVPVHIVPILLFFVALNVGGAAGDLLMVILLLSFPSDTVMEDNDTGLTIYGPGKSQSAA